MSLYDNLLEKMDGTEYSTYWMAWCPWHNWQSHTKSLMVHEDGFKCLSCGKSGDLKFLAKKVFHGRVSQFTEGTSKHAILPKWRKWENKFGDLRAIANHAHGSLFRFPQHQAFFKKRKIDQFIEQGYFGYIDGWALFPVLDQQYEIIDIVVRATSGKGNTRYVLSPSNSREAPYLYVPNWKRVLEAETCYVVYGIVDAWSLEEIGLPAITGTTGKSLSAEALKDLPCSQFVIIPDKHEEDAAYKLANKLAWKGNVLQLNFPLGTKDCDEIRMKLGNDYLLSWIGAGLELA